ncbi:MAG: hypothetical protein WDM81_04070 [Rhizomicrobium sp.]
MRTQSQTAKPAKINIFDTTLRERRAIARRRHDPGRKDPDRRVPSTRLGVDIIEAGFPISSPGDFEAVKEITKIVKKRQRFAVWRAPGSRTSTPRARP